jgi:DNA-binding LacI/PurR family transcriptional regulator
MSSGARKGRKGRERGGGQAVMTDVAKLARVSHQTVSRVLHDSPHVKGDTRERVLAAIRQLNYRPNSVAQALVTGRSRVIGVVTLDMGHYGPATTLLGIEEAAHNAGYAVSITSLRSRSRTSVLDAVQLLRDQAVEGVVVIAPHLVAMEALSRLPVGLPVVAVGAGTTNAVPVVSVDQIGGAKAATQHLLDLGHRTVWHLAGPADWIEAEQRVAGWQAALKQAGAPVPALLRGDWSAHSGYEQGRQLLENPDATAVFVANDQMALGLLRRLHEVNREKPRHISIVGFDDIPEAGYFTPPLTTVRQDFPEVGRRCIHLLLGQIEGSVTSKDHVMVPIQFILRQSTAAAKGR